MDLLKMLERRIGHTPLHQIRRIPIPNGNRIYAKEEFANPTGSHYDRVYLRLFSDLEERGRIHRNQTPLIEVSSGCAGASFAWFCRELGYACQVILPAGLPRRRIEKVRSFGANVILSNRSQYVAGAVALLRETLAADRQSQPDEKGRLYCVNHAEREETLDALEPIGAEVLNELGTVDYFVGACGNGASLLGVGKAIKAQCANATIISCDPAEAPVSLVRRFHGNSDDSVANVQHHLHDVFGTGAWGVHFRFLDSGLFDSVVDDAMVVSKHDRDSALEQLHTMEGKYVGRSSAMVLAEALRQCEFVNDKTFLVIFYDEYTNYL